MSSTMHKILLVVAAVLVLVALIVSAQGANCQVPNCAYCTSTSEYTCLTCQPYYIYNGGQCAPPTYCGVTNCDSCVVGNPTNCAACANGYVRTSTGLCAVKPRGNGAAAPTAALWIAAAAVAVSVLCAL